MHFRAHNCLRLTVYIFIVSVHRLFEQCPESKLLFGFERDLDPRCDQVVKSKAFLFQAANFINMIDMTLNMLGPDIELLTEAMTDLGHKHATAYGVEAQMFPIISTCLLETLEEFLGHDVMTLEVKACWEEVLDGLTADMLAAYPESKRL
jgi:hemoglobin-like flavoprotein